MSSQKKQLSAVAYLVANKIWFQRNGEDYRQVILAKDMPKPAFKGDRYDIEVPLYTAEVTRLSAAAPELLMALADCVSVMERDLNGLAVIQPELRAARAAITKATGQ